MKLDIKSYKKLKEYMTDKSVSEAWIRRLNNVVARKLKRLQKNKDKKI